MKPTEEQENIVAAAQSNNASLMISAYAGCAKSTTLEMIANHLKSGGLALAFNKKIADELKKRFPPQFDIMTLNGLGHRSWMKAIGKGVRLEEKKLGKLVTEVTKASGVDVSSDDWDAIRRLAAFAMSRGLVPSTISGAKGLIPDDPDTWASLCDGLWLQPSNMLIDLSREVITRDIKAAFAGEISFDDQIYCSTMLGGVFPRYALTLVDEAQDLSPLNHVQLQRCSAGRLIVVGDPKQAIYSFRGADSASMAKIRALRSEWIDLPLATTFRCPKMIVRRSTAHAPGFTAWPTNPEGAVHSMIDLEDRSWTWRKIEGLAPPGAAIAVLCRNNAPLLSMAFKLLRQRVSVVMLGRDIGKNLITLAKKILPDASTSTRDCVLAINAWRDHEITLAMANDHEEKVDGINDRADCLLAVLEGSQCQTAGALGSALSDLFSRDTGRVTLSTGHRAKGLEWDLVLHLDPWRIPSRWARQAAERGDRRQMEQELNLKYVIETRTKHSLVLANLEDFHDG